MLMGCVVEGLEFRTKGVRGLFCILELRRLVFPGLGVWDLGFTVEDLGFQLRGLGFYQDPF